MSRLSLPFEEKVAAFHASHIRSAYNNFLAGYHQLQAVCVPSIPLQGLERMSIDRSDMLDYLLLPSRIDAVLREAFLPRSFSELEIKARSLMATSLLRRSREISDIMKSKSNGKSALHAGLDRLLEVQYSLHIEGMRQLGLDANQVSVRFNLPASM